MDRPAQRFGVHYSEVTVWKLLRELNWSPQKPEKRAREADREAIERWETERWPQVVAQAEAQGRTVVFVDESGVSPRPARKRTSRAPGPHAHPGVQLQLEAPLAHRGRELLRVVVCRARRHPPG